LRIHTHVWDVGVYKSGKLQGPTQRFDVEADAAAFAKRRAVEEVFDAELGRHIRVAIPINVIPWFERVREFPDGVAIVDELFENDGHTSQRVYSI